MKRVIHLLILSTILWTLSCTIEECNSCAKKGEKEWVVSFSSIEGITKSTSLIKEGVVCKLYLYKDLDSPLHSNYLPGTPLFLVADSIGNMSNITGEELILPQGIYNFYAISCNDTSTSTPLIEGGISLPLTNRVDYLWAATLAETIDKDKRVDILFRHLPSQIEITLSTSNSSNAKFHNISMRFPAEGSRLNLEGGVIEQASLLEEGFSSININNGVASEIVLPLKGGVTPIVKIEATIEDYDSIRVFEIALPTPQNGLEGGKRYLYNLKISGSYLLFSNAVVEDWIYNIIENQELIRE